ncbi:hypothetical protein HYU40_00570 [Candidatus Woesearchaeota archaeon]|nr:hypothetical protein [Candidatus Woesearchaeota archaeon]
MAADLSWGQLITAAIVAVVVFFSVQAGGNFIAHAADKISDITGIPPGQPSIKVFTATPDGNGNMRFQLSLGSSTSDVGLQIYQLYTPAPDKDLANTAPDFKKENMIFDLIPDSEKTGQKLTDELKNGVINPLCPQDATNSEGKFTAGKNGCESSSPYKPGGYRFDAVLKKDGKTVDNRNTISGFYDESYVEMLNKPVFGCDDPDFGNCNVMECKKVLINKNQFDSFLTVRRESGVLRSISIEFRNEKGFNAANDCGKVGDFSGNVLNNNDQDSRAANFVLKGCSDKDMDDLNIKVARARLLEAAFEYSVQKIDSEDKYVTDLANLDSWKKEAVTMTMSCTKGRLPAPAPKGAYVALQSLGWQFVPIGETPKVWQGRVNAELDKVIGNLRPVITDAVAGINSGQIALTWTLLPPNSKAITSYRLELFHTATAINNEWSVAKDLVYINEKYQITRLATKVALPDQPAITDSSYRYPKIGGLSPDQMGTYWLVLTAFDAAGQSSSKEAKIGVYDNRFIEYYRDFPPNDKGLPKIDDACGSGCDVAGKKESALGNKNLGAYTRAAFYMHKGEFNKACYLEPQQGGAAKIVGCVPSEVDLLYREVVTAYVESLPPEAIQFGKTAADLLKFDCWTETWMDNYQTRYVDTGIKAVCDAKNKLKQTLDGFHWGYMGS